MAFLEQQKHKVLFVVAVVVSVLSFGVWAETHTTLPSIHLIETVPVVPYHEGEQLLSVPHIENGTLYLSALSKDDGSEYSRKELTKAVYRLADMNALTGQYAYQTIEGSYDTESSANVITWIGDKDGNTHQVYKGAGDVRLSPGGNYIALVDQGGILRIAGLDGRTLASFGHANTPVFSSDGTKLAFFRGVPYSIGDARGIAVLDLTSSKTLTLYYPDGNEYYPLAFTEDGETLFFTAKSSKSVGGPTGVSGVDVWALSVSSTKTAPKLVTIAAKLPYISGYNVVYDPQTKVLYLGAEGKMWAVDVSSGGIVVHNNIGNALWIGYDAMFVVTAPQSVKASTTLRTMVDLK